MIPEFYENIDIFITGGSGVVGTALIDKLLRSCNVNKIYLLLRPKRNFTVEQRLEKVKKAMVFRQLKIQKPNELNTKLVPIPGDAKLPLLGITPEYSKVLQNVSVVFHCAATVRFDEPLKSALKLNVGGTLEALKLAESLKKLKVFMHVSTFFTNPYLKYVESKMYESPMDWKFCLDLIERNQVTEDDLDMLTRKLIVGFPNTYTFTKNMAESLVNDYKHKLPVCIYRPSIVFFALEDPEPGFSPSFMGFMGLFGIAGAGLTKTVYMKKNLKLDLTPQDIGTKTMLYYALKAAEIYNGKDKISEMPIYMTSLSPYTELTLVDYMKIMEEYGFWHESAYEKNLLTPGVHVTTNRLIYMLFVFVKQIIPALLVDFMLIIFGRKPQLMAIQRKVFQTLEVLKPFMFNNFYSSGTTCFKEMCEVLRGTDFNINILEHTNNFYVNVGFCHDMAYSVRDVLFREDAKTLPKSRRIFQLKFWLYRLLQLYLAYKLYLKAVAYGSSYFVDTWQSEILNSTIVENVY